MNVDGDSSRLPSDAGRAHPRPWLRVHEDAGPPSRPDTGDVSVSGLAGIIVKARWDKMFRNQAKSQWESCFRHSFNISWTDIELYSSQLLDVTTTDKNFKK